MGKILKNVKGFAMSELLVVSVAILFIFSILFSNYLPLVAEYENRISYNDVTSQYAAHYIRKMYKNSFSSGNSNKQTIADIIDDKGYFSVYGEGSNNEACNLVSNSDKEKCNKIIQEYGIEEIIITNYVLTELKEKYDDGPFLDYIKYLPTYINSNTYEESTETFRIILKTKNYGYATTSILINENDTSKPNHPVLSENMIPVYYDNEKWIKADESNENEQHPWYNYDEKMWANAVTVYEESQKSEYAVKEFKDVVTNINSVTEQCTRNLKGKQITATFDYENNKIILNGRNNTLSSVKLASYTEFPKDAAEGNCGNGYMLNATTMQSEYNNGKTIYDLVTQNGYAIFYEMSSNVLYYVENVANSSDSTYTFDAYEVTTKTTYIDPKSYNVAKGYKIENNKFYLTDIKEQIFENDMITNGYKYMCTDLKSNNCEEIYEIIEIKNYKITKANKITYVQQEKTKLTFKDGHTENCKNNICTRKDYLDASPGVIIPMEDINSMFVWVPRFRYKVWNYNSDGSQSKSKREIEITFERDTNSSGAITCQDQIQGSNGDGTSESCSTKLVECTNSTCNGKTYTHPAFTFGDKNLTGIWVGKFENPNKYTEQPIIKPNVTYEAMGALHQHFANILKMNDSGNIYGFTSTDYTHMAKNTEWGAITYFSHSKYGKNGKVEKNGYEDSSDNHITGCGPVEAESTSWGQICNSYNTSLGITASTTGNVYGIYDMSGGLNELVVANIISDDGSKMILGEYSTNYSYPSDEYIDKYSYGTTYIGQAARKRSKLGDAIKEVYNENENSNSWYGNQNQMLYNSYPWLVRGGEVRTQGNSIGIFFSGTSSGGGTNIGTRVTSRTIIAIEKN